MLACGSLGLAFLIASQFVEDEGKQMLGVVEGKVWGADLARRHLCPVASYITLTHFISWCCNLTNPVFKRVCPSLYIIPVLFNMLGFPLSLVSWLTNVVSGFMVLSTIVFTFSRVWTVFCYLKETMMVYQIVRNELGPLNMLVLCIRRMLEPSVLACYWATLFAAQCWSNGLELVDKKYIIQDTDWMVQGLVAMAEICESPLMLISFCVVVMVVSCASLLLTQSLLSTCGAVAGGGQPLLQSGVTEGVVAFVLGLQTGLTDMEMPGRIGALSIILFVVVASLLQSSLEITHPVLLSLPATNRRLVRHLLPLVLAILLLLLPMGMVYALLTKVSSDLWTLVIISSCLVTTVQALGTLITYFLFVWDSMLIVPSPYMDDYVYYVKASTRVVELLLAVAVVGGGFYESVTLDREWSMLNTLVLVSHCYFNIYSRISQGWASYLARRETSKRLSLLRTATPTELSDHGDVCSICYQDMENPTAVLTQCNHYFHKNCLKRWLVVQDNCPLCTKAIVAEDRIEEVAPPPVNDEDELAEESIDDDNDENIEEIDGANNNKDESSAGDAEMLPVQPELRQRHVGDREEVSHLFDGD